MRNEELTNISIHTHIYVCIVYAIIIFDGLGGDKLQLFTLIPPL